MTRPPSIRELLEGGADEAPAIAAPGAPALDYRGLRDQVDGTIDFLNGVGIGRADRVATVLANGPEAATCFLAIASSATAAPLNPQYRKDEFAFYLEDLRARALVVGPDAPAAAVEAAAGLGVPIVTLTPTLQAGAGRFTLDASGLLKRAAASGGPALGGDIALVLHTSGTTSRPKIVPLSGANLAASAGNVAATLKLSSADRGLEIMPLFHIHGLVAGVLAPLLAGGTVFFPPPFNALGFYSWVREARPTWWTAVPTMHQAILARADRNRDVIEGSRPRFLRSSSASLPPTVLAELEATFSAPVIEAYGMTEAAHQMTSNRLPPGKRKPGTVGVAAGPEVAVMDEAGALLAAGKTGEVVIRGPNVTAGYENNPQANAAAFTAGWFRTGDQGVMDADGYLTITGRLKEIINRGGEKVSPREVDEALMDHPAVLQAVCFAAPHDKLGEEVCAAVVLRAGAEAGERELTAFVAERLAPFKRPRRIVFLDEIPKGPTGKLQRIGLAQRLGIS
ncbi:MAG TPA: acyl--CoA ligase [Caulobacteraceae bacterium]|nr:acyl--CoA ligase [Caulobacteraceae bacterium]